MKYTSDKWNKIFEDDTKYRDLNDVFILQLIKEFKKITGKKLIHVVDLGCGTGDTLAKFCTHSINGTGVDFSAVALSKANKKFSCNNDKINFIEANLENLENIKIETPKSTLWLCKLVIAFIQNRDEFFKNILKKMKVDDMLLVITPILHNKITYQKEDKPSIAINQDEIEYLLLSVFGNKCIFSDEYHGQRGHIVSYLMKR